MAIDLGVILTLLLVVGFFAQWLAWRLRLPAILFLLLIGIAIGPATGWFDPDQALGAFLFPVVSLAVEALPAAWRAAEDAAGVLPAGTGLARVGSEALAATALEAAACCALALGAGASLALSAGFSVGFSVAFAAGFSASFSTGLSAGLAGVFSVALPATEAVA